MTVFKCESCEVVQSDEDHYLDDGDGPYCEGCYCTWFWVVLCHIVVTNMLFFWGIF